MSGTEGIVYIQLCKACESLSKLGIVLLLFLVEADVLNEHNVAVSERVCLCVSILTDNVGGDRNILSEQLAQTCGNGCERVCHIELTLRSAQMGAEDDPRAVIHQVLDGRKRLDDSLIVGDNAVLHRYVEIASYEHALAAALDILNSLLVIHQFHLCKYL